MDGLMDRQTDIYRQIQIDCKIDRQIDRQIKNKQNSYDYKDQNVIDNKVLEKKTIFIGTYVEKQIPKQNRYLSTQNR